MLRQVTARLVTGPYCHSQGMFVWWQLAGPYCHSQILSVWLQVLTANPRTCLSGYRSLLPFPDPVCLVTGPYCHSQILSVWLQVLTAIPRTCLSGYRSLLLFPGHVCLITGPYCYSQDMFVWLQILTAIPRTCLSGYRSLLLRGLFNLRCHHSLKKRTSHLSNLKLLHPLEVFSVGSDAKFKPPTPILKRTLVVGFRQTGQL